MRGGWAWALALLLAPAAARAEVDVTRYVVALDVDVEGRTIAGDAAVELIADGAPVELDLVGYEVDAVWLDGAPVPFTREGGRLRLGGAPPGAGEAVVARVFYHGAPLPYVEPWGAWGLIFEEERVFTLNVTHGARHWLPSHDQLWDRAALTLSVTAPAGWAVAAPGARVGVEAAGEGRATTTWRADWPLPTYQIHFAAAPYRVLEEEHDGVPYIYWIGQETDLASAQETLSHAPRATALWASRYGPYPFPKVGFAEINLGGAVENASCVSIGHQILNANTTFEEVIAHELAHAWFQGVVTTATWEDLWLSEGLATWHEALYYAHLRPDNPRALGDYARSLATGYKAVSGLGEGSFPLYNPRVLFGVTTYRKGALVFHMLRYLLGESVFDELLRAWASRYRFQPATTADFQALAEEVSGRDLFDFFDQWVYRAGYPDYRLSWQATPGALSVRLRQVQAEGGPFTLPVELEARRGDLRARFTVEVDGDDVRATVPLDFEPDEVILDPDNWLLKDTAAEPWELAPDPDPEPEPEPAPDLGLDLPDLAPDPSPEVGEPDAMDLAEDNGAAPVDARAEGGCGCISVVRPPARGPWWGAVARRRP